MDFVAFPLRIGASGWLARSGSSEESILQLLKIMASTPQRGWTGSSVFGLRDTLALMRSRHDLRLAAIKQMNQALEELEVDWVRVENIEPEPASEPHQLSYTVTLAYAGKGVEVHRIEL